MRATTKAVVAAVGMMLVPAIASADSVWFGNRSPVSSYTLKSPYPRPAVMERSGSPQVRAANAVTAPVYRPAAARSSLPANRVIKLPPRR